MKTLFTLLYVFVFVCMLHAQNTQTPSPIIFIYDASGSMWDQIQGKPKIEIASEVLSQTISRLPDEQKLGLVVYGHRDKQDCQDVEFVVDVANGTKSAVSGSLTDIKPLGKTPLAYSVKQVIDKLRSSGTKATVILVTDGNESCNGNICDVVSAAKKEGIDFRMHIVGFGLGNSDTEQLKCAASAGGGQYYDAADAGTLGEMLTQATSQTVDESAGNFSLFAIKNGQPIDALVKVYPAGTDKNVKSARTYGDTSSIYLSPGTYDLVVQALGGSDVSGIKISDVQITDEGHVYRTVSFDAAKISVNTLNNGEGWDAVVRIYPAGDKVAVASGRTYGKVTEFELNPGVYDVFVEAIQMEGTDIKHTIEKVEITGGVKNVEHNFKSGIAMIGAVSGSTLVDATVNIYDSKKINVASGRTYTSAGSNPKKFILTPGTYEVVLKGLSDHSGKSETFTINVIEGQTVEKTVNF